jgi:DNA-binding HxlR family transcriptional regulator
MARCGMAQAARILGDKWVLLILREAFYGVSRFDDLRADIDAPRAILSDRLRRLVADGVLEKLPYRDAGDRARFEYRLTERGRALSLAFMAMMEWADEYLMDDPSPVELVARDGGAKLRVGFVKASAQVLQVKDVRLKAKA